MKYFLWGVLFAYLPFILLWVFGKVELKRKTGPPNPQKPPKPRKEPKKSSKPSPFEGLRMEVVREGGRRYMIQTQNGKVLEKSLCPLEKYSAEDWERTIRASANLIGLKKVGEWTWEWRGEPPKPTNPPCYTTTYRYDAQGNCIGKDTVLH